MKSNKIYPDQLSVSIIIITYERVFNVIDILKDLKSQSFKEFEVIVVSDGCKTAGILSLNSFFTSSQIVICV